MADDRKYGDFPIKNNMTGNRTEVLMSRESIQKIQEAEARAERLVEDAKQRARAMQADAERQGREECDRIEEETVASLRTVMEQLRERTEAMSERMKTEAEEEAKNLRDDSALRRRSAEKIVIRGLMSKCR